MQKDSQIWPGASTQETPAALVPMFDLAQYRAHHKTGPARRRIRMNRSSLAAAVLGLVFAAGCAQMPSGPGKRELMIVGNDEKQSWDDAGKAVLGRAGKDSLSIIDIGTDPLAPKIIANLPLDNTIVGPPVNLAITPDESLALLANSINVVEEGGALKQVPDTRLFVIDLTTNPPKLIDTVTVGKQPSGMSINRAGNLALVANRNDNSISVLRIAGKKVTLIDTVPMGEQVSHVRFTPDGKRAVAAKFPGHKIALLDVNGEKVTYNKVDVTAGLWPYNVDVTPDGKLAISADNGNAGAADGHVDTVTVIDLEANPPRAIDKVVVGDAPEGFAISPTGKLAVAVLLRGTNADKKAFFYNRNALVVALKIDGKKVTRSNEVEVRGLPEGVVFSADGRYIYVGNFIDQDISILRVDGDQIVNTGKSLALPGHPASMRGRWTH
jgi:DNA-binding beta-propeller fold protein YncE